MILKIAKILCDLLGVYNANDEDHASVAVRFRLDNIPSKYRLFIYWGLKILHGTLIKPPTEQEIEQDIG